MSFSGILLQHLKVKLFRALFYCKYNRDYRGILFITCVLEGRKSIKKINQIIKYRIQPYFLDDGDEEIQVTNHNIKPINSNEIVKPAG